VEVEEEYYQEWVAQAEAAAQVLRLTFTVKGEVQVAVAAHLMQVHHLE
jgi:hypothetical protein